MPAATFGGLCARARPPPGSHAGPRRTGRARGGPSRPRAALASARREERERRRGGGLFGRLLRSPVAFADDLLGHLDRGVEALVVVGTRRSDRIVRARHGA